MAFQLVENNHSMTCRDFIRENPLWAFRNLIGAAFVAISLLGGLNFYIWYSRPDLPIIIPDPNTGLLYAIEPRDSGGAWLTFHFKVDPARRCIRQAVHLLYRDQPDGVRDYFQLGASLNGAGMKGVKSDYRAIYLLPIDFPPGPWQFVYRARFGCPPLELIPYHQSTTPIIIDVPPMGFTR